jgi:hypothetical protein
MTGGPIPSRKDVVEKDVVERDVAEKDVVEKDVVESSSSSPSTSQRDRQTIAIVKRSIVIVREIDNREGRRQILVIMIVVILHIVKPSPSSDDLLKNL